MANKATGSVTIRLARDMFVFFSFFEIGLWLTAQAAFISSQEKKTSKLFFKKINFTAPYVLAENTLEIGMVQRTIPSSKNRAFIL